MDQDEFSVVEDYLRMNQYPKGISKGDKANLRRKCKNFKFDCGVLYFRRVKKGEGDEEGWKICVRTEDEKRRILESCHAGIEGKTESIYLYNTATNVRELTLSFQSPMLSCIRLFQCQMFGTTLVTSCVGII